MKRVIYIFLLILVLTLTACESNTSSDINSSTTSILPTSFQTKLEDRSWLVEEDKSGFRFNSDGTFDLVEDEEILISGDYTISNVSIDGNSATITFYIEEEKDTFTLEATFEGDQLIISTDDDQPLTLYSE